MKKIVALMLSAVLLLALTACGRRMRNPMPVAPMTLPATEAAETTLPVTGPVETTQPETPATTEATTEPTEATAPPVDTELYLERYRHIIDDYAAVVRFRLSDGFQDKWSKSTDIPGTGNTLKKAISGMENVWQTMVYELTNSLLAENESYYRYILHDLNADGVPELFWTRKDRSIAAVFTWYDGQPVLLAAFYSRCGGYIDETGSLYICSSSGAANNACEFTQVNGRNLERIGGFGCDAGVSGIWFYEITDLGESSISQRQYNNLSAQYPCENSSFWQDVPMYDLDFSQVPEFDSSYLLEIPRPDQSIWSGPGYDNALVGTIEKSGIYTIVEEATDYEGIHWGKLKSGAGWVDLDEIALDHLDMPPVSANYADNRLLSNGNYYSYTAENTDYAVQVAFRAYEDLTNVRLLLPDFNDPYAYTELYALAEQNSGEALVATISFPGDMSSYRLVFLDSRGYEHTYSLYMSGRNGSLVFSEVY